MNGGSITTSNPLSIQGGILRGNGTITGSVSNTAGTVAPGLSAGTLNITGAYTNGGTLAIELGGLAAGSEYDQLRITGAATLGGLLSVSLINNFRPNARDEFVIMTYGSASGTFTSVTGLCLGGGLRLVPIFGPTSLTLRAVAGAVPDFDPQRRTPAWEKLIRESNSARL